MPFRLPARKTSMRWIAGIAAVYVLYLLLAWLALPRIIQGEGERIIADKSAHRLTMDRPEFNPFTLALRVPNLRLEQPDGKPLLTLGEGFVDLSATSLLRGTFVFDAIRLTAPAAEVVLLKDGSLNWTPLLEALKSKQPEEKTKLPRLDIRSFRLSGGHVGFADEKAGFATQVDPIDVELDEISSVTDENGRYAVAAKSGVGAQLSWRGDVDLRPISVTGHAGIEGLDIAKLAPYFKQALPASPAGTVSLEADYRLAYADGKFEATLDHAKAGAKDLRIPSGRGPTLVAASLAAQEGRFDLASRSGGLGKLAVAGIAIEDLRAAATQKLGDLAVEDVRVDLGKRNAGVARIALTGGRLAAKRAADGRIDLADAMAQALPRSNGKPAAADKAEPWHFNVEKVEVSGLGATLRDESVSPAAVLALEDIAGSAEKISDDLKAPIAVQASFRAPAGGSFKAEGQVVPAAPSADLKVELVDLSLKPAEPYIGSVAKLTVAGGKLSADGRATYGKQGPGFKGGFQLRDLRLDEAGTKNRFLIWKSLAGRNIEASPARVDIRDLAVEGLDASLLIAKDKTVNLSRILRSAPAKAKAAVAPEAPKKDASAFVASIAKLRIARSELDFADQSLALPFGTRIHHLRGVVTGLSTRPGGAGLLEVEGQVDDYGLARAAGRINLFDPTAFADVNVVFRNVEMTRLTPYSATFLGRKITSGKLSLDLQYKFNKRQVEGDNKVVMDRLTLGERVESPEAKNLPLDLAIAILQDSDGRIELGLPVSGSLDDPQFSYGGIVWKAITNVLTKIATAPFRALASLFGSGEKFDSIAFEPGNPRLTPPEREKLVRVAAIMNKRPGLSLTVHGVWSDTDRVALQDRQLRRAVAQKAGQHLEADEDPGPLSTQEPKIQSAIESIFADRFGGAELAALKDGFRKANPGQLPESTAGKMMSRLTGLLRSPRELGENEVAQLKGVDFYAVLLERARAKEPMSDERLAALAQTRGINAAEALKGAGAPLPRLTLGAPEKVEASAGGVPLKLDIGTAAKAP
jgi:hypothetical protein